METEDVMVCQSPYHFWWDCPNIDPRDFQDYDSERKYDGPDDERNWGEDHVHNVGIQEEPHEYPTVDERHDEESNGNNQYPGIWGN
jgi:hypothetical protein